MLIVLAYTVVKLPFSLRMIKAAFYSIDTELEDAARNMGASGLRTFLKVKLPIILPSVLAVFALIRREVLTTVEWVRMDRGTIFDDDALARIQARLPRHLHGTAEYLVRRWNDPIVPVEGMADVARDLKNAGMAGIVFHGDTAHLRCQLADRGIL